MGQNVCSTSSPPFWCSLCCFMKGKVITKMLQFPTYAALSVLMPLPSLLRNSDKSKKKKKKKNEALQSSCLAGPPFLALVFFGSLAGSYLLAKYADYWYLINLQTNTPFNWAHLSHSTTLTCRKLKTVVQLSLVVQSTEPMSRWNDTLLKGSWYM